MSGFDTEIVRVDCLSAGEFWLRSRVLAACDEIDRLRAALTEAETALDSPIMTWEESGEVALEIILAVLSGGEQEISNHMRRCLGFEETGYKRREGLVVPSQPLPFNDDPGAGMWSWLAEAVEQAEP